MNRVISARLSGRDPVSLVVGSLIGIGLLVLALMAGINKAIVIGLTEHAPLILAAMGFSLLYRLTGLINVAYAETVTLGAYFGVWLNGTIGWDFYEVLVPAGLLAGVVSVGTYFAIFAPAKRRNVGLLEMILISFGLSILLRHGLQFIFGYPVRFFEVPIPRVLNDWYTLNVGVSLFRLVALGSVIVLALGLYWFIQKSNYGLQIRALASDEDLAQASGIRPLVVTVLIWFIAGIAGGFAGAFYGVGSNVAPLLGWRQFLFILLVVLVGGTRSIGGVIVAGIGTGIALAAMTLQLGQVLYGELILITAFVVILKVRSLRLADSGKV